MAKRCAQYTLILLFFLCLAGLVGAKEVTITGQVLGPEGEAVAGAKVWVKRFVRDPKPDYILLDTATSAEDGSFALVDVEHEPPPKGERRAERDVWFVSAYAEGLAVDAVHTYDPASPVQLELLGPGVTSGRIVGEDGKPIAGASVMLSYWEIGDRHVSVTKELAEACAAITDESGAFELQAAPEGARVSLRICADGYGAVDPRSSASLTPFVLESAGSIQGKVICPEKPELGADLMIRASRNPWEGDRSAFSTTITDGEGNFHFEELPPGPYEVRVHEQRGTTYHIRGKEGVEVNSGQETVMELRGEKTAPVWGRVVEEGTFNGVARARVTLYHGDAHYSVTGETDADGLFEVRCLPGNVSVWVYPREGHVEKGAASLALTPAGAGTGAIEVERSHRLVILVVNEDGQPVPGATVAWQPLDSPHGRSRAQSNHNGLLEAKGLPAGRAVVRAEKGDLTAEPRQVQVEEQQAQVQMVLKAKGVSTITARIVDQNQAPVLNATVRLTERHGMREYTRWVGPPDDDGRVTAKGLVLGFDYRFSVQAPGCDRVETEAWTATEGASHDFGIITLVHRQGFLAGVVVDEAGQPMAGVKVFNSGDAPKKVVTATDERGWFRLAGLAEGQAYAFVDSPGHHFTGVLAPTGTEDLRIVLEPRGPVSVGEPIVAPGPVMLPGDPHEIAKQLLLQAAEETHGETGYYRRRILTTLAELDPQAAFGAAAVGGDEVGPINIAVGCSCLADDFEQAVELIAQGGNPEEGLRKLLDSAAEYQESNPQLALRCLEVTLNTIPLVERRNWRVYYMARIGNLMLSHDQERGMNILATAHRQAEHLGVDDWDAYARGVVAANICERDLDAALGLIEPIWDEDKRDRHLRNIARRIAKTDPDRALNVLRQLSTDWKRQRALAVILPFFPGDQFDRAVGLAREIEGNHNIHLVRPRAIVRLSCVGPARQAASLIEEAVASVEREAASSSMSRHSFAEALGVIACIARRLGYERHKEVALRAASYRTRGEQHYGDSSLDVRDDFEFANLLAFTVLEAARHVIDSALNRMGGVGQLNPEVYGSLASAAAQVDVNWALELLQQMRRADRPGSDIHSGNAARLIAKTLLEDPAERETWWLTRYESWLPVDEDQ